MLGDLFDDRTIGRLHVALAIAFAAAGLAIICFASRPILAGLLGACLFIPCRFLWARRTDIAKYPMNVLPQPQRRAYAVGDRIAIALMAIALIADFLR